MIPWQSSLTKKKKYQQNILWKGSVVECLSQKISLVNLKFPNAFELNENVRLCILSSVKLFFSNPSEGVSFLKLTLFFHLLYAFF